MTLPSSPRPVDSLVARWDPRWKLVSLSLLGLAISFASSLFSLALSGIATLVLIVLARATLRSLAFVATLILAGVLPFAVALPFLSETGLRESIALIVRSFCLGFLGHIVFSTAPPYRTFAAFAALGIPAKLVALLQFTYRHAMILAHETKRIRIAMTVRGFRPRPTFRTASAMGMLAGSILVRGGDRAETVHRAMLARGYRGTIPSPVAFRTTTGDAIGCLIVLLTGTLIVWLN